MIRIDGSLGEGGGQTVRTALSLAAVTGRDVEISGIRANRRVPGLGNDLLAAAKAVAAVSRGRLEGDAPGSRTLRFYPGLPAAGEFEFAIGDSATGTGSVALLFQTLAPVLAVAGGRSGLVLRGGTHGPYSPTATYLQTVFVPTARKLGLRAEVSTPSWGWAPRGVGELRARVEPVAAFRAAELTTRGELLQIGGSSVASGLEDGFAERQRDRAARRLAGGSRLGPIQIVHVPSDSAGAMLFLLAVFERTTAGFTGIAEPNGQAEHAADEAVDELLAYQTSYSVLDKHVADQVLVYAALAKGVTSFSTSQLTPHTRSTAEIIEQFLPAKVSFAGDAGGPVEVEIVGAGYSR
jgi:RNA 3'-terminal phosphate cyclase (ATP)